MTRRALDAVSIASRVVVRGAERSLIHRVPDRGIAALPKHQRAARAMIQASDGVGAANLRREAITATANAAHTIPGALHVVVRFDAAPAVSGQTAVADAAVRVSVSPRARRAAPIVFAAQCVAAAGHARVAFAGVRSCVRRSCVRCAVFLDPYAARTVNAFVWIRDELQLKARM